ncbi:RNA polymerase sigma factor [Microbacterium sp. cf332]|uniref:RNA polymerase sigma factor n=1 Tax=Microbacterium sp. cf332 TaxID=1761804 RepID=UPI00088A1195|nr:RNA polymerase sigma factor [Microbacterium sp. cf332]SDQ55064.1 RNA polymerase sigma-70 factor, ECF subfamily [Microbacterium sp. cf332]
MTAARAAGSELKPPADRFAKDETAAVAGGGDRAFEEAVAPLVPLLLRYFARRVTPTDDAADCTSETLVALWRHRSRLPAVDDERRAWAYGIARKVLSNHHRGEARRDRADEALRTAAALTPVEDVPDEAFIAAEAVKLLPARDQELVRLVVWEELSIAAAGRVMGINPGTARTRYARALGKLRLAYSAIDS